MKTRTFIAIEASAEIRAAAQQFAARLGPYGEGFRWVAEETMHFTLQFLGDITDQEIADVCSRVGRVAAENEPFTLAAHGAGAFPAIDRPRTLWIGVGQGAEELNALQGEVEAGLADLGFRGENRRYLPHLTIGKAVRSASGANPDLTAQLEASSNFEAGAMAVNEITVFASQLLKSGPEYHMLARCPLGG